MALSLNLPTKNLLVDCHHRKVCSQWASHIYMAHGKVNSTEHLKNGEFFFETPPQNCTNMLFFLIRFTYTSCSWCESFRKYQVSIFRCYLGCVPHTQSWVFFQIWQKTATVLIWGDRGYPPVQFEYKTAYEGYVVAET